MSTYSFHIAPAHAAAGRQACDLQFSVRGAAHVSSPMSLTNRISQPPTNTLIMWHAVGYSVCCARDGMRTIDGFHGKCLFPNHPETDGECSMRLYRRTCPASACLSTGLQGPSADRHMHDHAAPTRDNPAPSASVSSIIRRPDTGPHSREHWSSVAAPSLPGCWVMCDDAMPTCRGDEFRTIDTLPM